MLALLSGLPAVGLARETAPVGIATFNMAWAGTFDDFRRHAEICSAPEVNGCGTRSRASSATHPVSPQDARTERCREATLAAAGGFEAMISAAPCGAYGIRRYLSLPEAARNYRLKLEGLRATVEGLIRDEGVRVIAFQEIRSQAVIDYVLGDFASRFNACVASHEAFQTVGFAWERSLSPDSGANDCTPNPELAIASPAPPRQDASHGYRTRPGLALRLTIGGAPVTFLNIHLKAGCAHPTAGARGDPPWDERDSACGALGRQIPALRAWIGGVARSSPRFVLLGDFNRRIDEELTAGAAPENSFWRRLADGLPDMRPIPPTSSARECGRTAGLDHIVISAVLWGSQTHPPAVRRIATTQASAQAIPTSDHCPNITTVEL